MCCGLMRIDSINETYDFLCNGVSSVAQTPADEARCLSWEAHIPYEPAQRSRLCHVTLPFRVARTESIDASPPGAIKNIGCDGDIHRCNSLRATKVFCGQVPL